MGTQTDKIQQLEDQLTDIDNRLTYYGELFNADGDINRKEQKDLDKMKATIKKIKAKIAKRKAARLAKFKKRKFVDKAVRSAKNLILELENVFVKGNLKETSYQKLQDYSMEIATISERIKKLGVLDTKAQSIVDELGIWDKKIHEAIEEKVAAVNNNKKQEKKKEEEEITHSETPIQVELDSFSIIIEGDILIKCSNGKEISKHMTLADRDNTIYIPRGTTGAITVDFKLTLKHGSSSIKTFNRYETINTHYKSDSDGNISINELKISSHFNRKNIVDSIINQLKIILASSPDDKSFSDELKKLIGKVNQQTIVIDTKSMLKNNTIIMQAKASVDDSTLDMGASLLTVVSLGYSAMLFKGFELNMQVPIIFESKKSKKEIKNSNIKFDENQAKLDADDKNQLHQLIITHFTSLVEAKLKKDFGDKKFSKEQVKRIRNLTLLEPNRKFYTIHIEGTTSCTGSEEVNRKISKVRQKNVQKCLVEMGVKESNFALSPTLGKSECIKYIGRDEKNQDSPRQVKIGIELVKLKFPAE